MTDWSEKYDIRVVQVINTQCMSLPISTTDYCHLEGQERRPDSESMMGQRL